MKLLHCSYIHAYPYIVSPPKYSPLFVRIEIWFMILKHQNNHVNRACFDSSSRNKISLQSGSKQRLSAIYVILKDTGMISRPPPPGYV